MKQKNCCISTGLDSEINLILLLYAIPIKKWENLYLQEIFQIFCFLLSVFVDRGVTVSRQLGFYLHKSSGTFSFGKDKQAHPYLD